MQTFTDANSSTGNVGDRVRTLEDSSKAKNSRISGLDGKSNENPEETLLLVWNFIHDQLEEPNVCVEDAFRANFATANTTRREIIARLASVRDKAACLISHARL